jgi:hypothetical protein
MEKMIILVEKTRWGLLLSPEALKTGAAATVQRTSNSSMKGLDKLIFETGSNQYPATKLSD